MLGQRGGSCRENKGFHQALRLFEELRLKVAGQALGIVKVLSTVRSPA
jgi:alkylation response protein AidB-like acyl-CoA dehydrogenase